MNAVSPGAAYRLVSILLLPFWLLHAYFHGKNKRLKKYLRRRVWPTASSATVWVHASSVGEVNPISALVRRLIEQGESVLFTSFTATGFQAIQNEFPESIESSILPIDFFITCRWFVSRNRFKLCILMETELWPELLYQVSKKDIPIIQVNARLSEKSIDAPLYIRYLLRRSLENISLHLTRDTTDRTNLLSLGAEPERIKIIGNIKSRVEPINIPDRLVDRDYLLLASSHEDEEYTFLKQRPPKSQNHLIVIAPRHPNRSLQIQQQLAKFGINIAVRSKGDIVDQQTSVYLADTLGELKVFMAYADVVIMGGSFDQTGGHNLIEPANLGCAIITGPSDSNIRGDIDLLAKGLVQVSDMEGCWQQIEYLQKNPEKARQLAAEARLAIHRQADVIDRYLSEIQPYL